METAKAAGTYLDPTLGRVKVNDLGPTWLAAKRATLEPSSFAPLEVAWRLRVQPRWGRVAIADISHSAVKTWVAELNERSGATVVIRTYGVLASILDDAVLDRRLPLNPARGGRMGLPKKTPGRHIYLSHAQVEALAQAAGKHGTLIRVLAYTGLRWGEVAGLRVENVDLQKSRIWVSENAVEVGGTIHVGTPKSHKVRYVPMPRFLRDELAIRMAAMKWGQLVFPTDSGGHMKRVRTSHGSKSWFKTAAIDIGVPTLKIHGLRHTTASLAVQAGANVKALQRMLGHASAAMTLDTYADLFDDDIDAVSRALDHRRAMQLRDLRQTLPPHAGLDEGGVGPLR
ncbi:site-specific integrase [Microbacterium sp. T2.11-28]|uniref:tyrosine-type recombinase/integrase n=1 Tax=Microbacterium sp. T2.11-28 TaxID=3041169 RepID=UPI00254240C1|nr:site-specific integrase [Microbacterium sp. T2.11-28]